MRRKITSIIEEWDRSGSRTALLIRGSRQVGKTYSIKEYGDRVYGDHFLEINFVNDPDVCKAFEKGLNADSIILRLSAIYRDFDFTPGNTLIFLDEIQNCPNARAALKPLALDGRYKVIASGSLLGIRMKEIPLTPTGYLKRVEMFPMDFEEFLWALNMPQEPIDEVRRSISECIEIDQSLFESFSDLYRRYLVVGGMPAAVSHFSTRKSFSGLREIFDEIVDGYGDDISKYAKPEVRVRINACLSAIPTILASENHKFKYASVTPPEGEEPFRQTGFSFFAPALDWLSMANISLTCYNVTSLEKPVEERSNLGSFKLYMLDTGVLVSRYNDSVLRDIVLDNDGINLGAVAENAVAMAFAVQHRSLMYYSKDDPRMEIDFVMTLNGRTCCINVKYGSNRNCRSLNTAMSSFGADGVMFETRNIFMDEKGVRHYPLFASSFMDAIDPRMEMDDDYTDIVDKAVERNKDITRE